MTMIIDEQKLHTIMARPVTPANPAELRRDGKVFFVGGDLAVNETLETMFESFCMESTDLFHLSFGARDDFHRGEELARQIKKNFNVRLMGRLEYPASERIIQRAYAAGVDILDISAPDAVPSLAGERGGAGQEFRAALLAAGQLFPRWSAASTLVVGPEPPVPVADAIDVLLNVGVMPLVALSVQAVHYPYEAVAAVFDRLATGWERHHATVQPFLPLISLMTPLVPAETTGRLRGLINRIHDRHLLAASDLRRHLRVKSVNDSLDSAGL